jgi:hypothetical protein
LVRRGDAAAIAAYIDSTAIPEMELKEAHGYRDIDRPEYLSKLGEGLTSGALLALGFYKLDDITSWHAWQARVDHDIEFRKALAVDAEEARNIARVQDSVATRGLTPDQAAHLEATRSSANSWREAGRLYLAYGLAVKEYCQNLQAACDAIASARLGPWAVYVNEESRKLNSFANAAERKAMMDSTISGRAVGQDRLQFDSIMQARKTARLIEVARGLPAARDLPPARGAAVPNFGGNQLALLRRAPPLLHTTFAQSLPPPPALAVDEAAALREHLPRIGKWAEVLADAAQFGSIGLPAAWSEAPRPPQPPQPPQPPKR